MAEAFGRKEEAEMIVNEKEGDGIITMSCDFCSTTLDSTSFPVLIADAKNSGWRFTPLIIGVGFEHMCPECVRTKSGWRK